MQFLPIVERELRVASRHSRTWWRRILTLLAALVVVILTWLAAGRWTSLSQVGQTVFATLSSFGFVYALLAGPLATADCLSCERREGTLGLLFLTDLRGYDVVLGKMAASSFDVMLGLLAALPLLAMPLLAGGVTLTQFSLLVLVLADVLMLSLAAGVFSSSLLTSGRAAFALTFGILFFLTLGLPFIGEEILKISVRSKAAGWFYMSSPLWLFSLGLRTPATAGFARITNIWLGLGGIQVLAWVFLVLACWRTARHWREVPQARVQYWWSKLLQWWRERNPAAKLARRRLLLEYNPIAWLESRDRVQERVLAALVCAGALFCAVKHARFPQTWPTGDLLVLWPIFTHYLLCLWICVQAPRRFADDKQSGALELLLCTTLPVTQIVKGTLGALWRRFGRALVALVLLDAFLVHAHVSARGGWSVNPGKELLLLCILATLVFPIQGYTLAVVGLHQGLIKASSLRATVTLVWNLGLLPWVVFIACMMACDIGRRYFPFLPRTTEEVVFCSWAGAHLTIFVVFLIRASWQLRHHFRALAAGQTQPWWKRVTDALLEDFR